MSRSVDIETLLSEEASHLQLSLRTGREGLVGKIHHYRIQKPGLALTGYTEMLHPGRVQILGSTELAFLANLDGDGSSRACVNLLKCGVACIICTKGMELPAALTKACEESNTPLFSTPQVTSIFISRIETYLEMTLAPRTMMHGVLLDVFGEGVLLLGKSGIGKSECALDLIQRGHRLIADDIIDIRRKGAETIYGHCQGMLQHHIEIRGLGILNIRDLFGVSSVRDKKRIDLVIELVFWRDDEEYDRLGLEERRFPILDVELPLLTVPVRPGRNVGSIIEVAARNQLLKSMGSHTAEEVQGRLKQALSPGRRVHTDDVD